MPEYEIIEEGKTGFFFKENDINDLTRKIENWFRENNDREAVRQSCYKLIDEKYNPYGQVKVLKEIILKYCESSPN